MLKALKRIPTIGEATAQRLMKQFGESFIASMLGDNLYEFINLMDGNGELVFSDRSVVYGASYADVHAQVVGYQVLTALALAGFGVTVYDLVRRRYTLTLTAVGALIPSTVVRMMRTTPKQPPGAQQ